MKRRVALIAALASAVVLGALPAPAGATFNQWYCGYVVQPTELCTGSGAHSFRYNSASYPGPPQHNVYLCSPLYNTRTQQTRGGIFPCGYNFTSYDYGATSAADYVARAYIHYTYCCAHTIDGYAHTNTN